MALPVISSKSDNVIRITLTDSAGDAIDPSGLASIEIGVYQKREVVLQKWESVTVVDGANGICEVYLDKANLGKIEGKRMFIEVAIGVTNANFEDNIQRMVATDIALCDIALSVL